MRRLRAILKSTEAALDSRNPFGLLESVAAILALALIAILPTVEAVVRGLVGRSFFTTSDLVQHLVLWVALLGGMITSREDRHLCLSGTVKDAG